MTRAVTTHPVQHSTQEPILYLAFELGHAFWKLGFSTGRARRPRERTIEAGDLDALEAEITLARQKLHLPAETRGVSCYEAGRDGFWLHRFLDSIGVRNSVVDSASLEVNRRARRIKTDRLDLGGLLRLLIRFTEGEREVWSVVHVPSPEAEDARHLHRELRVLKRDRGRVTSRIRSLLVTQGLRVPVSRGFEARLDQARLWDERPRSLDGDRDRLGLAPLSTAERALDLVQEALREGRRSHAPHRDRRPGPTSPGRALAIPRNRCSARGCADEGLTPGRRPHRTQGESARIGPRVRRSNR